MDDSEFIDLMLVENSFIAISETCKQTTKLLLVS